ncbi:hypothetical protein GCM10009846_00030 [Agrococcus versicolor]|uniref:Uncharacterized protein n=1 Tax=Agrococcus versicolor TaxID=501482 RepID=A0ABP5M8I0_9MICO
MVPFEAYGGAATAAGAAMSVTNATAVAAMMAPARVRQPCKLFTGCLQWQIRAAMRRPREGFER